MNRFDETGRTTMTAVLDRLIPAIENLPAAGAMGVADDIEHLLTTEDRFSLALKHFMAMLPKDIAGLSGDAQDICIREIEASSPAEFALVLEISYLAYYSRPDVHARIGWRTGPLQPRGFDLPPFDESILEVVRRRSPFWRQT